MTDTAPLPLASRSYAHHAWAGAPSVPLLAHVRAPGAPLDLDLDDGMCGSVPPFSHLDASRPSTDPEFSPYSPSWPSSTKRPSPSPALAHHLTPIHTSAQQLSVSASLWPLSSTDSLATPSEDHPPGRDHDLEGDYLARMAYCTANEFPSALGAPRSAPLTQSHLPFASADLPKQDSSPPARSQFVQAPVPQVWAGMPSNGPAIQPLDSPALQRYGGLDTGNVYDDPTPAHPLNLDLTRQLDAASSLPPPPSPWDTVPTPQYPAGGVLNSRSSPTHPTQEEYAYDFSMEQSRAAQAALVAPQWPAGDRPRIRSHSVFSSHSVSQFNAGGGAPTPGDLLAARLGQLSIAGQRSPVARRQTTATNAAPTQGLEALRSSNELLAAVLRATPATGGSIVGGPAAPGAGWPAGVRAGPAPMWPSDGSAALDHAIPSTVVEGAYERGSGPGLSAPGALLPDLHPREEKGGGPARAPRSSEHGPAPAGQRKAELYKTELCRKWSEKGSCRYGAKCQFAHGAHELRPVERHHLYKTQVCRTFASTGVCPYSYRCCFIHPEPPPTAAAAAGQGPEPGHKAFPSCSAAAQAQGRPAPAAATQRGDSGSPPRHADDRHRHRPSSHGSKSRAAHRAQGPVHGRRSGARNSSSPSAAGAAASASAAVDRLHEALHQARAPHAGTASSVAGPADPASAQRRPRARSQQHPERPALNPLKCTAKAASVPTVESSASSSSAGSLASWPSSGLPSEP